MSTDDQAGVQPRANGAVVFALIMSLLWLGGIGSVLGLVFGIVGARQADREGTPGNGIGVAAAILGLIGVLAGVLVIASGA